MPDPQQARRTFGPVVALGLAVGALAAVAGARPWMDAGDGAPVGGGVGTGWSQVTTSPLSTGLAFVVLACWGVLLVTRGRFRRGVAALAVLAGAANLVTVALAPGRMGERVREEVRIRTGAAQTDTELTAWFWIAVLAGVLVLLSTGLALRFVGAWPEMGTRYDAPTGARDTSDAGPASAPTENIDIWKALDEGRDPTA